VAQELSSGGVNDEEVSGNAPKLSVDVVGTCRDVIFIHASISSTESGLSQELSSLAHTGTTNRPDRIIPRIRPTLILVHFFNVIPPIVSVNI
jgi:hypothetical protein